MLVLNSQLCRNLVQEKSRRVLLFFVRLKMMSTIEGLAEAVSGSGKEASVTLCLTIGTGIGGCLIMDGESLPWI